MRAAMSAAWELAVSAHSDNQRRRAFNAEERQIEIFDVRQRLRSGRAEVEGRRQRGPEVVIERSCDGTLVDRG